MSLPLNQIIVGDCTEVMQTWPADSIDLVVTSPPYWGLRFYGEETVRVWGGLPECEHEWIESESGLVHENRNFSSGSQEDVHGEKGTTWIRKYDSQKAGFCSKCGAWRGSLGLEAHPQLFIDHLVEICQEIKRVLKPSGTFWLNLGDTYYGGSGWKRDKNQTSKLEGGLQFHGPLRNEKEESSWLQPKQLLMIPARVAIALQDDGWILRSAIIWHKPNHMPSSVTDRLTNAYEHIFLFAKNPRYYFDLDSIRQPHAQPDALTKKAGSITRGGQPRQSPETSGYELKSNPLGKNPGDLWRIPTTPFPGAHFATFPPKLIEPIIKAGCPQWICSRCGKPRTRITETESTPTRPANKSKFGEPDEDLRGPVARERRVATHHTVGWSDCGCEEGWVGGIVLDPFAGSGTALRVARRLGRRFIGIEINPAYAEMARQRVRGRYKPRPQGVASLTEIMEDQQPPGGGPARRASPRAPGGC